jgi:hypothetical protein
METSNSVRYAVAVFVLGLSVALSAPQAFAIETNFEIYPGDTCVKLVTAQPTPMPTTH